MQLHLTPRLKTLCSSVLWYSAVGLRPALVDVAVNIGACPLRYMPVRIFIIPPARACRLHQQGSIKASSTVFMQVDAYSPENLLFQNMKTSERTGGAPFLHLSCEAPSLKYTVSNGAASTLHSICTLPSFLSKGAKTDTQKDCSRSSAANGI